MDLIGYRQSVGIWNLKIGNLLTAHGKTMSIWQARSVVLVLNSLPLRCYSRSGSGSRTEVRQSRPQILDYCV